MNAGLWLGLADGIAFGFLLQKGRVLRFERQVGAMPPQGHDDHEVQASAIVVGMFGILLLADLGVITLGHKAMNLGALLVGGAFFGTGGGDGYCPGTAVRAGEGRGTRCSRWPAC